MFKRTGSTSGVLYVLRKRTSVGARSFSVIESATGNDLPFELCYMNSSLFHRNQRHSWCSFSNCCTAHLRRLVTRGTYWLIPLWSLVLTIPFDWSCCLEGTVFTCCNLAVLVQNWTWSTSHFCLSVCEQPSAFSTHSPVVSVVSA